MKYKNRLFQIAASVTDMDKTIGFYRDILGFSQFKNPQKLKGMIPSKIQGHKKVNALIYWMNDANPSFQLEFFQYFNPPARPMPEGARPCDIGYSRMRIWIADFDGVINRLKENGIPLITEPKKFRGGRRVCLRDPDGIYLELMEKPIMKSSPFSPEIQVAVQSVTLSVPALKQAEGFFVDVLGMERCDAVLHTPEMESLWGLTGAETKSSLLKSGNILFELVEYLNPRGRPMPDDRHIGDAGIWHIAVLFNRRKDFMDCYRKALSMGHSGNSKPVSFGFMDFVYMRTDQNFFIEFARFPKWMGRVMGI
jgi:catechol 2,3-dioxygenase-like lactoylglutathione lyase family enzyme